MNIINRTVVVWVVFLSILFFSNNILAKCGLNSFYVGEKCKDGNYISARFQCYGQDFRILEEDQCQPSGFFSLRAREACRDVCEDLDPPVEYGPTPISEIIQEGENEVIILRGLVLTPDGPLDGEVLIRGEDIICVAESCEEEEGADQALIIETNGLISPGLIDAHNHLSYNFLPEWESPQLFQNRYQWSDNLDYEEFVSPIADNRARNSHFCPASKWGELRSLIHGTTTIQGQSYNRTCIRGGVRNADHAHQLDFHDHMQTTISSPRDITDNAAQGYIDNFNDPITPTTRFVVHMAEGFEEDHVLEEFDSFDGLDPRNNRHRGQSLLEGGNAVLIHSIPLNDNQLDRVLETESKIVWSPSSNIALYNQTTNIEDIIDLGIKTGIGPDWTVSGEDNMLDELRYAFNYGVDQNIDNLTSQKLWEMATQDGAQVVGLENFIGSIEVGKKADLVVFGRSAQNPYDIILQSRPSDIRLVMIGGVGYYGDQNLQDSTGANEFCEEFIACGSEKYICVQIAPDAPNRGDETLGDIEDQLIDILAERADELLDLVSCE